MDRKTFQKILTPLVAFSNEAGTDELVEVYFHVLKDLPPRALARAVADHIQRSETRFFPAAGALRKRAEEIQDSDSGGNVFGPDGVLGNADRIRKAAECRCRGTGLVDVMNHGGFVTPTGLPITDKTVCVSCNCSVGIALGIARAKPVSGSPKLNPLPVYNPGTMQLMSDWWRENRVETVLTVRNVREELIDEAPASRERQRSALREMQRIQQAEGVTDGET